MIKNAILKIWWWLTSHKFGVCNNNFTLTRSSFSTCNVWYLLCNTSVIFIQINSALTITVQILTINKREELIGYKNELIGNLFNQQRHLLQIFEVNLYELNIWNFMICILLPQQIRRENVDYLASLYLAWQSVPSSLHQIPYIYITRVKLS